VASGDPIAALDIGGTHVTAARVHVDSASVEPESRLRREYRPDESREELLSAIVGAAVTAGAGLRRCGVAVPGPFDYTNGICTIRGVGKLESLYGVDLRRELADAMGISDDGAVRFLNDAEAFVLGEWWAGAASGHDRVIGLTLGTGLGSGFLEGGVLVDDRSDVPPEGSLYLVPFRGGQVEEVVSSRGLLASYGTDAGLAPAEVVQLADRARAGEQRAREAFADVAAALGELVLPWVRSFQPTCLVVGGSIARSWDLLAPTLVSELACQTDLTVTRAANLDDAALLGAARHAAPGDRASSPWI